MPQDIVCAHIGCTKYATHQIDVKIDFNGSVDTKYLCEEHLSDTKILDDSYIEYVVKEIKRTH